MARFQVGNRRGEGWIELRGRLLPVKDEPEDNDGDEDVDPSEGGEPEFLDAEEIESGAVQIQSLSTQNTKVMIVTEDSKEFKVTGFFPLTDPWWSVSVKVKPIHAQWFARGFPSYTLEDDILQDQSVLSLFLKECGVHDDFRSAFMDWARKYPPVTFSRLMDLAEKFTKKHKKDIRPWLMSSESGSIALKALKTPLVLRYLPKLLPHKVRGFLMLDTENHFEAFNTPPPALLFQLEDLLDTEPWKLGFGLLLYRELHLCGCEASFNTFLECEQLLEKIPDLQQNALYIYNQLKEKCMNLGDTYLEQSTLTEATFKYMTAKDAWEAIQFLKEQQIVVIEKGRVFLYNNHLYEVNSADLITKLVMKKFLIPKHEETDVLGGEHNSQNENEVPSSSLASQTLKHDISVELINKMQINESSTEYATKLDAEQQTAARMILANPVTVISGKGGCGKTTVVSLVFKSAMQQEKDEIENACKAFEDDMDASEEWEFGLMTSNCEQTDTIRTLLTAPTGKAASILGKKTELPAATLHQITCSYSAWKKQQRKKEESGESFKSRWKFSNVEALVVDEGSLVSVRIFSAVLKLLCTHAKLEKLVILGDIRQLPSIEPGNLLADIFATFKRMNWAIELKTNHRAESQLIVDNATRISSQLSMYFDAAIHFDEKVKPKMPNEEKKCILVSLADETYLSAAIKALIQEAPGLKDDKHSQFIAFRRKDCLLINELCCTHYSGHTMKNHRNRYDFRCNDKVCCTKNAYVKDLQTKSRQQSKDQNENEPVPESQVCAEDERICNGEIFYITEDVEKDKIRELTLSDGEDRTYTLNYKALRRRSGLNFAWARTIHTFQGSEEDTVVYVLGTAGRQNWKHVYTAVTRGRKRVYIIARSDQLDRAIAKKSRDRKTRLQQRLKDKLSENGAWPPSHTSGFTNPESTQMTQYRPCLRSQEQAYTQLNSPPYLLHPSVPSTPDGATKTPYTKLHSPAHLSCPSVPSTPDGATKTPYTKLHSPPHVRCPSVPSTPDGSHRNGFEERNCSADPTVPSPPDSQMYCENKVLDESPSQKRMGIPVEGMETPSKLYRVDMNLVQTSPSSQLQKLTLGHSCHKKLFNA